jgi:hypothetical protein
MRARFSGLLAVPIAALLLSLLAASAQALSARTSPTSHTSKSGVTYSSEYSPAWWDFQASPVKGTLRDAIGNKALYYKAQVVCASFLTGGRVYFGAKVIAGKDPLPGYRYVFWWAKAGGPNVGELSGQTYKTKTCYNGHNGSEAGTPFTITSGSITVK